MALAPRRRRRVQRAVAILQGAVGSTAAREASCGSRARVTEVLSGWRRLTLDMVRRLRRGLGVPAEVLLAS